MPNVGIFMSEKKQGNNFIVQAGILAAAGIVSRIIGLLYRSPLTSIIGDEGNGYYGAAYYWYTIILLVASYSIPSAISKVISQKLALKEYRNAHRVFKCAFVYVIVVGGLAAVLCAVFAPNIVDGEAAAKVLRVFAPTIFFSGILGVLRGYFQAHKSMVQTSVSQILEQILNALVSIGAAFLLINFMMGSMMIYDNPTAESEIAYNTERATYGAMGSALGTGAGVLIALFFMAMIYILNRKMFKRRVERDRTPIDDSYGDIFKLLLSVVTPFILSTAIYNLSPVVNQKIFITIMTGLKGIGESEAYSLYGIYSGKPIVISNIPIAISSAFASALIPGVSSSFTKKDYDATRRSVSLAIKCTMLIAIPSAVGLGVLAKPVTRVLFPQVASLDVASKLLMVLAVSVIFYSLSTMSNAILQGIGKVNIPVINAAAALLIQTGVVWAILVYTDLGLYSLVIGNVVYSGCMCIFNNIAVAKYLDYRQEAKTTFILPLISALVMGAVAVGVYYGIYALLPINIVAVVPAIVLGVMAYGVVILKSGAVTEEELSHIPKGKTLINVARKFHLLH
jgi:stage V sporulation protein B